MPSSITICTCISLGNAISLLLELPALGHLCNKIAGTAASALAGREHTKALTWCTAEHRAANLGANQYVQFTPPSSEDRARQRRVNQVLWATGAR